MFGVVFEEIECKSLINRVQGNLPFRWTINPYRGCQHACVYCFARPTHEYLGHNSGQDFNRRIVVKANATEVLRQELRHPRWRGEMIALGTACDPYEPAENKYQLTRKILQVILDFRNPLSITTKSNLILRDLDILRKLASVVELHVNFSISTLDERLWKQMEPKTPRPMKRLQAMEVLVKAGINTGVLLAPILPSVTDNRENLEYVVKTAVEHGAQYLASNVLFLKPGTREWFMPFLREAYPHLSSEYLKIYKSPYAPKNYTKYIFDLVDAIRKRWNLLSRPVEPANQIKQLALGL